MRIFIHTSYVRVSEHKKILSIQYNGYRKSDNEFIGVHCE